MPIISMPVTISPALIITPTLTPSGAMPALDTGDMSGAVLNDNSPSAGTDLPTFYQVSITTPSGFHDVFPVYQVTPEVRRMFQPR